jgi:hypothetical protein
MYAGANTGHPPRGLSWSVKMNLFREKLVQGVTVASKFFGPAKG